MAEPHRYAVLTGSSAVGDLLAGGQLRNGIVVWSMWAGHLGEPSGRRLAAQVAAYGVPLVHHHTSGHAPLCDLKGLVAALRPARVVPIHTEGAHEFARHFSGVTPRGDGTWWVV